MGEYSIWKDVRVEKIAAKHLPILASFKIDTSKSDEIELKDFLIEDAFSNQEQDFISRTYLIFHNPGNKLAGYITLLADNVHIRNTGLAEQFRAKGIQYDSLPALKIARMCIDVDFRKKGLGTFLVRIAMRRLLEINERVGCRFLIADAKRDARHFYKKLGFEVLKEKEKGHIPMYLDMKKQIEYLREHKKTVPFTDIK
jgi:ribosomal protein S18 acetylase RimI-like enzyme